MSEPAAPGGGASAAAPPPPLPPPGPGWGRDAISMPGKPGRAATPGCRTREGAGRGGSPSHSPLRRRARSPQGPQQLRARGRPGRGPRRAAPYRRVRRRKAEYPAPAEEQPSARPAGPGQPARAAKPPSRPRAEARLLCIEKVSAEKDPKRKKRRKSLPSSRNLPAAFGLAGAGAAAAASVSRHRDAEGNTRSSRSKTGSCLAHLQIRGKHRSA